MTINTNNVKPPLDTGDLNQVNDTINQTTNTTNDNNNNNNNSGNNNKSMRKSLIPIINQKNYYSKFPFEKIDTIVHQDNNTAGTPSKLTNLDLKEVHKEVVTGNVLQQASRTTIKNIEKNTDSSSSNSSNVTKQSTHTESNSNKSRQESTSQQQQQLQFHQAIYYRQNNMSPQALTPRNKVKSNSQTPRQTLFTQPQQLYQGPPALSVVNKPRINNIIYRQNMSPQNQSTARISPCPQISPHSITPRNKPKLVQQHQQQQAAQQIFYHQQFSSPQTLNNRNQSFQIKTPFKVFI